MAAPTRILSLSLGTQTVGLAEFKTGQNGGLVLASYQTRELLADPAADATRLAQAKLVLEEMVQARKAQRREGQLRHFLAVGLHALRQAALRRRGAGRSDRHLRGAAERPLPDQ